MGVENYHVIELVGEGSFGKVYKGRRKYTGQTVAMKFILKHGKSEKDILNLRQEIEGELFEILEDDKCLPEEQVQAIAKQLVRALHYLHSNRIIHRDMKPQNILIGAGSVVKLIMDMIRYELFVGQPPFYTNSVYALIRHIIKDPVKYPDNMSPSFRNFLKGLLNKEPQNRLTWPALLEHPFVKQTLEELEAKEIIPTTDAATGCNAAWRVQGNIYMPAGLAGASPDSKNQSPVAIGNCSVPSLRSDPQSNSPNLVVENPSPREDFPGFTVPIDVEQSGCRTLDRLENNSRTIKGAKLICQDNEALSVILLPLKNWCKGAQNSCRDQDILSSNQSMRILLNLVASGAINTSGILDEIIHELLGFTANIVNLKSPDVNDIIAKSFSIIKKLVDNSGGAIGGSYLTHWIACVQLYSQVVGSNDDAYGRVLCESTACIAVMLSRVAHGLKACRATLATEEVSASSTVNEILKQVLDHVKVSGVADLLCSCLAISGSSLMSGSSHLLRAACEACRAIWSMINAFEIISIEENTYSFPLNVLRCCSLLQLDVRDHDQGSVVVTESEKIVDVVTKAFLRSKATQVAIYYCLRQRLEAALSAAIQITLRCSVHSGIVSSVLCGLPSSLPATTVVSGGGDGTVISEIFSVLSFCASSSNKDPQTEAGNAKCKMANPSLLVLHSCLILATVAQFLKSSGRTSALFMLTTSSKKQLSRLSVLAHHFSSDDKMKNSFQIHCASAMLALASILSLESGTPLESSISEIAVPLIPRTASLCDYLKIVPVCENGGERSIQNGMLSYWHGLRDGCVGLLESRLKWGGPLAVQQLCASGIPLLLVDLLANGHFDASSQGSDCTNPHVGLSPVGVVWAISSICQCLSGGVSTFRQILVRSEHVKFVANLISDAHLKLVRCWTGPGGGKDGIRDVINAVIDLLAFPFVAMQNSPGLPSATASVSSGFLLNVGSPGGKVCMEDKDMVKAIETNMAKYIQILLEVGVPDIILQCLEHMELKDIARPIAFLAKMTGHRPLAIQLLRKGLLDPGRVRRLLSSSCPREVTMDVLMIVSDLARMDKAKHQIVGLLIDRCADSDKRTRKFACFAIGNAAYHNDLLYEELRRSIPQLANLLLSAEEDKTKANAAGALSNLVRNSNKLCEDIVSKGAMQALLKLVADCSVVALNPSRKDAINESPLKIALFSLAKMCAHLPCREFLRSSDLFSVIGRLRQSPESTISNYASVIISKTSEA
ncbi:non-specific serine,threonine protein kinase [Sarracenia purpurea var. burkii]